MGNPSLGSMIALSINSIFDSLENSTLSIELMFRAYCTTKTKPGAMGSWNVITMKNHPTDQLFNFLSRCRITRVFWCNLNISEEGPHEDLIFLWDSESFFTWQTSCLLTLFYVQLFNFGWLLSPGGRIPILPQSLLLGTWKWKVAQFLPAICRAWDARLLGVSSTGNFKELFCSVECNETVHNKEISLWELPTWWKNIGLFSQF